MKNVRCKDRPGYIYKTPLCLYTLSKNAEGELQLRNSQEQPCPDQDCLTLKTRHTLSLDLSAHACDSPLAGLLDGQFVIKKLMHAFIDGNGEERGVHGGRFVWNGVGAQARGSISGITNAGTHRAPVFQDCQPCDARGFMEGRFCGTVVNAEDETLIGCQVLGTYRLQFDPSQGGGQGAVQATFEGVILCECGGGNGEQVCIDFESKNPGTTGPNPWVEQNVEFLVNDHNGNPKPNTQIDNGFGANGLDCGFSTEIELPALASRVEARLVHAATPATMDAFDSANVLVGSATMSSNGPETLTISAADIKRVVITPPQNETALLRFCYDPQ